MSSHDDDDDDRAGIALDEQSQTIHLGQNLSTLVGAAGERSLLNTDSEASDDLETGISQAVAATRPTASTDRSRSTPLGDVFAGDMEEGEEGSMEFRTTAGGFQILQRSADFHSNPNSNANAIGSVTGESSRRLNDAESGFTPQRVSSPLSFDFLTSGSSWEEIKTSIKERHMSVRRVSFLTS